MVGSVSKFQAFTYLSIKSHIFSLKVNRLKGMDFFQMGSCLANKVLADLIFFFIKGLFWKRISISNIHLMAKLTTKLEVESKSFAIKYCNSKGIKFSYEPVNSILYSRA